MISDFRIHLHLDMNSDESLILTFGMVYLVPLSNYLIS